MVPSNKCSSEQDFVFDDQELSCWLAYSQMKGLKIGSDQFKSILDRFEKLTNLFIASKQELLETRLFRREVIESFLKQKAEINRDELLELVKEKGILAYPYTHPLYPPNLRHIHKPPLVLYAKGELSPDKLGATFAIVGTRNPTGYGRRLAKEFSKELSEAGATIVSGMAVGVDSLVHWGALAAQGKTVCVLACGVDYCYPSSNRPLYEKIIEEGSGLIVSEFFPGTKPEKWMFPQRNRIISGLSEGLLVIEAGQSSGALITANLAFNQSRSVFAIPGRIDSAMSKGTNDLIYKNIAQLVTSADQILDCLNWVSTRSKEEVASVVELFGREKEVFDLLSSEPQHFDFISNETGMAAGELSGTLTILELAGVVERHPGEWFSKIER